MRKLVSDHEKEMERFKGEVKAGKEKARQLMKDASDSTSQKGGVEKVAE